MSGPVRRGHVPITEEMAALDAELERVRAKRAAVAVERAELAKLTKQADANMRGLVKPGKDAQKILQSVGGSIQTVAQVQGLLHLYEKDGGSAGDSTHKIVQWVMDRCYRDGKKEHFKYEHDGKERQVRLRAGEKQLRRIIDKIRRAERTK